MNGDNILTTELLDDIQAKDEKIAELQTMLDALKENVLVESMNDMKKEHEVLQKEHHDLNHEHEHTLETIDELVCQRTALEAQKRMLLSFLNSLAEKCKNSIAVTRTCHKGISRSLKEIDDQKKRLPRLEGMMAVTQISHDDLEFFIDRIMRDDVKCINGECEGCYNTYCDNY
jgi:chromosome segregation ATPase